jgi:hypothetical protein
VAVCCCALAAASIALQAMGASLLWLLYVMSRLYMGWQPLGRGVWLDMLGRMLPAPVMLHGACPAQYDFSLLCGQRHVWP